MMGTKVRSFSPFPPDVSLEDLVPKACLYRRLEERLDLSFVRALVRSLYAKGGRPSVDPVVFFKLQLVMFFEGIRSERRLMRVVADRLSLRWYLGYDLFERLPDHSSLTRIRERFGVRVFRRFFERIVEECVEAGLVWGKEMCFDATKVGANAAVDSLAPRWTVEAHLDSLFDVEDSDTGEPQGTTRPTEALPSADHEGLVAANAATGTDEKALRDHAGVHVQGTGFPWQRGSNVYIAGHRIGYVGTPSFRAFYDPESLEEEDDVILGGPDGETYLYVVYETLEVGSREVGVTLPVSGKSIVSLQTCTLPDYSRRVIVRAERVD